MGALNLGEKWVFSGAAPCLELLVLAGVKHLAFSLPDFQDEPCVPPEPCATRSPGPVVEFRWFQLILCQLFLEGIMEEGDVGSLRRPLLFNEPMQPLIS